MRHAMASAAGALKPGGWCNLLIEGGELDRVLAAAVAGRRRRPGAGRRRPSRVVRSGEGVALHFRKSVRGGSPAAVIEATPLQLGAEDGHLTYPELASASIGP